VSTEAVRLHFLVPFLRPFKGSTRRHVMLRVTCKMAGFLGVQAATKFLRAACGVKTERSDRDDDASAVHGRRLDAAENH
jgi:hypothetical protein